MIILFQMELDRAWINEILPQSSTFGLCFYHHYVPRSRLAGKALEYTQVGSTP